MNQDKMLQAEFMDLSNKHGLKCSFGYFIDPKNVITYGYNMVTDNDLMNMIANLVIGIANRNEATPEQVLDSLKRGINVMQGNK